MNELEPLETFCKAHRLPWSAEIAEDFGEYLALLEKFNKGTNLIGPLDREAIVAELFVDSLTAAVLEAPYGRVLDVGTGAGLPGIVLAIVFDEARYTLVEPRRKRVQFLRIAKHRLGLDHVELFEGRIEEFEGEPFDWAISKAFRPPAQWLETAAEWVKPGGTIVCLQSAGALEEAKEAAEELGLASVAEVTDVAVELDVDVPTGRAIGIWGPPPPPSAAPPPRSGRGTAACDQPWPPPPGRGTAACDQPSPPPAESEIRAWETLAREEIVRTPVFGVDRVHRRAPDGHDAKFFVATMPDWVNVVAITPDDQVVLIRQYRQGTDTITLEIPGGVVDEGESYLETGVRELREETGYEADEWHEIGIVEPNPALQDNRCATLVAIGARPTAQTNFDEHENIEVVESTPGDAYAAVMSQEITHSLVVAAFFHYRAWSSVEETGE